MGKTTKQTRASTRNWQKARLIGFNLDIDVLSLKERELYIKIVRLKNELLKDWDTHSAMIGGYDIPPYKCWCGKRTKVERLSNNPARYGGPQYLCEKHWKEEQAEKPDTV